MKTNYIVKVKETEIYSSYNQEEAENVFCKKIEELSNNYKTYDELENEPNDDQEASALYCSLIAAYEDGEEEILDESESFYM